MTTNRRAKRDARERKTETGEKFVVARRNTKRSSPLRLFEPDQCANCMEPLSGKIEALFCTELCRQTVDTVRY